MKIHNHLIKKYPTAGPYQGTHLFRRNALKGEPVVIKEQGKFIGILTLHDMLDKPHRLVIDSYSEKPVINTEDDLLSVLITMCQCNFEFLPVMKEGVFHGVASRKKLLEDFISNQESLPTLQTDEQVLELKKEIALKNKFLSIIGHDIKNLFTQVLGSLELLDHKLQGLDAANAATILNLARRSAEQVNFAFDGMLLWARLGTGQLPFMPVVLPLNKQINKITEQYQLAGKVKNITIKNRLSTDLQIFADANMLNCILLNLVYNAIKFTPAGGEIFIDAWQDEHETEIIVEDTGAGISPEHKAQLFSGTFSQVGTWNETGAGIGLVLCRDFVDKHQGKIRIDNAPKTGTKVTVTFPNPPHLIIQDQEQSDFISEAAE